MTFTPAFYRSAAVCSVLSAITTLGLIFLPDFFAPVEGFAGRMSRVHDPYYAVRSWVYFIHPFLVLMAAAGVAMRIRAGHSAAALLGLMGFTLWAFTEAGQQALTLFAFDVWRESYATADAALKAQIESATLIYDGLWNAMYFLLIVGFSIGNMSLGAALLRHPGFSRVVGGFLVAAFALTLSIIFGELQWPTLSGPLAEWSYPAIQPLGRTLIGVWLWRAAVETEPLPR